MYFTRLSKNIGDSKIQVLTTSENEKLIAKDAKDTNENYILCGPNDINKGIYLKVTGDYKSSDSLKFGNLRLTLYKTKLCFEGYSSYTGELKTIWEYKFLWENVVRENNYVIVYRKWSIVTIQV